MLTTLKPIGHGVIAVWRGGVLLGLIVSDHTPWHHHRPWSFVGEAIADLPLTSTIDDALAAILAHQDDNLAAV